MGAGAGGLALLVVCALCFQVAFHSPKSTALLARVPSRPSAATGWQSLATAAPKEDKEQDNVIRFENDHKAGGGT